MPETEFVAAFLRKHAGTYFAQYDIDAAIRTVRAKPAVGWLPSATKAKLLAAGMQVSGRGPAVLRDDSTERIYVAYHALRMAKVKRVRARVCAALNRNNIGLGRQKERMDWSDDDVKRRVNDFRRRLTAQGVNLVRSPESAVRKWLDSFRRAQDTERRLGPRYCV